MWNYRLCKKTHRTDEKTPDKITCITYEIHEAYYNSDNEIWAVTEGPVTVGAYIDPDFTETEAEKLVELGLTVDNMRVALHMGIIDLDTFKFAEQDAGEDKDGDEYEDDEFIELDMEDPTDN